MNTVEGIKKIYRGVFPDYPAELIKAIGNPKTLLDIGCGNDSLVKQLPKEVYRVGVDAFEPSLTKSRSKQIHDEYVLADIQKIRGLFPPKSFDVVLASDVIEHLTKTEGEQLLLDMERLARHKVIVFTPNGFLSQGEFENNQHQLHKSGWEENDFKKRGYEIIGINGLRLLRGEFASLKFRPRWVWQVISDLSQLAVRGCPKWAFQLLATKKVSG